MQEAACDFFKAAVAAAATGLCGTSMAQHAAQKLPRLLLHEQGGDWDFPCERGWHQCAHWNHPQSPLHCETWGCPLAPVKAVLWSMWGSACSRGVWCHGAVPTGVCRGLLCWLWLWCLNPWECLRSGTAMREGSAGKQKHSGTWESSQGLRERACVWGNPATVC